MLFGTQCTTNAPRLTPASQVATRLTYPGGTEGRVYLGGLPVSRQSPIQVVTVPGVEKLP